MNPLGVGPMSNPLGVGPVSNNYFWKTKSCLGLK
jgi:hypothetical protein